MIYLDNAATTKISKNALNKYNEYAEELFYNPSAIYGAGVKVKTDIEEARRTVLKALGSFDDNFIFTSSATEANNLALFGALKSNAKKVILSSADHPSTYNVGLELSKRGIDVDYCPLTLTGEIDYVALESMLNESVSLISVIHISNETGAINDLKRINELRNKYCPKAIFHADGVQAFSKVKVNVKYFGVDMYTISGHKIHGPKGVAGLFVKNGLVLKPIVYGGGQEQNLRSGTENVPAIMGLQAAILDIGDINKNFEYVKQLKNAFISNLTDIACIFNTTDNNSPYVLSITFKGVKGETLVHMMEENGILISTGSACSSRKAGNRVLEAMKVEHNDIIGSVRVSFSRYNTLSEVELASKTLKDCYIKLVEKLR